MLTVVKIKTNSAACRLCSDIQSHHLFSQGEFKVQRCQNCGFGTLHPIPSANDLHSIYQDDYHEYLDQRDYLADAKKKFSFVKKYLHPQDKLLDIGCGLGHFLAIGKSYGLQVQGYDVSRKAALTCQKQFGVDVKSSSFRKNLFNAKNFDLITAFDVIEHIVDFEDTITTYRHWLKDNGLLIMTTPNLDAWDAKLLGKRWYGYTRIPQHVNYFDRQSLQLVLQEQGLEVIDYRLWGFVRSYEYLAMAIDQSGLLSRLLRTLALHNQQVYLPMTDMMIVARKTSH